ncbi:MAG: GNAT family N-acetyltransferase [Acidiferrobacteraceae bacterium]
MRARRYTVLEEFRFNAEVHDSAAFDCETPVLNEYLTRFATQHRRRGLTQVYVLVHSDAPSILLGYYTLSAAQIDTAQVSEAHRKRLPRFPVPCFRMGRFAIHKDRKGQGFGKLLLGLAVDRCLRAREEVAAYALVVDAKNENAQLFYQHYGFTACVDSPRVLYLPLGH